MPAPPHHYETHHSSMTRNRRDSTTVGPDRHHRTYGRATQDENQPRSNVKLPPADEEHDPSNHIVVPQGIFEEPASSSEFFYRYPPILFIQAGFPEKGVNVGKMASCRPPTLKGDEDLIFKEVVEREVKVQINWPGYPPFERRIKTLRGALPRGVMAAKVANMVLDFAAYLQVRLIDR
ncbi:unnamed protein product [Cyclocybe aegerita]|uniref:Uncharacterized protein n=1 Tax=Cyclocybe aegerita TaxID=1973307 RepID=A0A8S0WP21_CYCAE|nr:unnamed protein product [Cyclocybe aegerita]